MTKFKIPKPSISQIELTNACNLKCPMCPRNIYSPVVGD